MVKKISLGTFVLSCLFSLAQPSITYAANPCESVDTSNVSKVKACLETHPQLNLRGMSDSIVDQVAGCQGARMMYHPLVGGSLSSLPTCSVLAKAVAEIYGKPPIWIACADYYENNVDATSCIKTIVEEHVPVNSTKTQVRCSDVQKLTKVIAHTILHTASSYEPPSCDIINQVLKQSKSDDNTDQSNSSRTQAGTQSTRVPAASRTNIHDPYRRYREMPTTKAWETKTDWRYVSPNDIQVSLTAAPYLGPKGFNASANDREYAISAVMRGSCEAFMRIDVILTDHRKFDFDAYDRTGELKHLPINPTLEPLRDVLKVQCPELKGLLVTAKVLNKEADPFEGHMLSSNDWRLIEGIPENGFGSDYIVRIQQGVRQLGSGAVVVSHEGHCETEPSLTIKKHFDNSTDKAFAKKVHLPDVEHLARSVIQQYKKECPRVEVIRFRFESGLLSPDYVCDKPEACLISAARDDWELYSKNIAPAQSEPEKPFNFASVIERIEAGDIHNIDDSTLLKLFSTSYIEKYGDQCRESLERPTKLTIKVDNVETTEWGDEIGRDRVSEYEVYLDKQLVPIYKKWNGQRTALLAEITFVNIGLGKSANSGIKFLLINNETIDEHLALGCDSQQVKSVYPALKTELLKYNP